MNEYISFIFGIVSMYHKSLIRVRYNLPLWPNGYLRDFCSNEVRLGICFSRQFFTMPGGWEGFERTHILIEGL